MVIRGINFKSLVVAGLLSGYIMYSVDKWFGGMLGLFGLFPGTNNPWWMLIHHLDSIIFALIFAWPFIYKHLPGAGWLKGLIWGVIWELALLVTSWVAGALGSKMMVAMQPGTFGIFITMLLLHMVWGFFLGVFYNAPNNHEPELKRIA